MKYIVVCLVCGCSIVSVAARCRFPGLTANAEFQRPFNLEDGAQEATVVEYGLLLDGILTVRLRRQGTTADGRRFHYTQMSEPRWFRAKRPTSPTSATILLYWTRMDLSLVLAIS
jgi:hypothetical protein